MRSQRVIPTLTILAILLAILASARGAGAKTWLYAVTWDSTICNRSEYPRTIGITSDYEFIWVAGKKDGDAVAPPDTGPSGPAQKKTIDLGKGATMEFVLIPAGSFYMGSPSDEKDRPGLGRDKPDDEAPVREVKITKPFYVSKCEVTQGQYMAVIGKNPSHFSGRSLPVETVSWDEAVAFCKKIGTCARLPTEAEWEYACRAGSQTRFHYGNDLNYLHLEEYAWYHTNSSARTHAVGRKKPNSFGLLDMHGNVSEWCSDWYDGNYSNAASVDPTGPSSGKSCVIRGGAWNNFAKNCRSANRNCRRPHYRGSNLGFRVALDLE